VEDNSAGNQYDDGSEGNYWSDYKGKDADGDGIGDIPYMIYGTAGEQDDYPLMKPWEW
jgi:nitrous oxidase accessory protein NosD